MDLLWKTETRHENALYVDLFRKLNPKLYNILRCDVKTNFALAEKMMDSNPRYEKDDHQSIVYRKRGDEQFHQMKWYEAMKLYNQCLCLAEIGSSNMGIGYAKRAQCFFQLKMYQNCLMDLDLARFTNYPRHLYDLLNIRETECIKLMAECDESETAKREAVDFKSVLPQLSFKSNDNYPEMANVLKIERNKKSEWQIIAAENIGVGKTLLIEKNFISMLNYSFDKCCVCSKSLTNLLPCTKCSNVLLCPECNCGVIHQVECDVEILFCGNYDTISDVFRSILLVLDIFNDADELMTFVKQILADDLTKVPVSISHQKSKYRAFLHFAHQSIDLIESAPNAFILFNTLMAHCVIRQFFHTEQHQRFLMHLIFHHQSALKMCGVSSPVVGYDNKIDDIDYNLIIGANFDHSCVPHLGLKMIEGYAVMITLRPIPKGQRVFISFNETNTFADREERQANLLDELGYKCNCERCRVEKNNNKLMVNDPKMLIDSDFQFVIHHLEFDDDDNPDRLAILMERAESFLERYGYQAWDECLNAVFISYYYAFKKKHEHFYSFRSQ